MTLSRPSVATASAPNANATTPTRRVTLPRPETSTLSSHGIANTESHRRPNAILLTGRSLQDAQVAVHRGVLREAVPGVARRGAPRLVERGPDRGGEGGSVPRGHEPPVAAVLEDLPGPALTVGGDDRRTARQCLNERTRRAFPRRGEHEHGRPRHVGE